MAASWAQYFSGRWSGQVAQSKLLIWDMLGVGSVLNLATGFLALILLTKGATATAVVVHFALLPYNFFLLLAVLRQSNRGGVPTAIAVVWFVMTLVL